MVFCDNGYDGVGCNDLANRGRTDKCNVVACDGRGVESARQCRDEHVVCGCNTVFEWINADLVRLDAYVGDVDRVCECGTIAADTLCGNTSGAKK